jgi:CheY-like chemotaxis protein
VTTLVSDATDLGSSDYSENAIVHGGRLDDGIELLSKPYMREAVARKIPHVQRNQQQRNTPADRPIPAAAPVEPNAGTRALRVLVVEDDELIRFTVTEMLSTLGYDVAEAGDAPEALALLETQAFDLLLADVTLPGMSGIELAKEAARRLPALRIVFASGRAVAPEERVALPQAVQLMKPYGSNDLAAAIRAVTGAT